MTMGEKILNMRKARGWSQEELAERIGVTRQAVSRWESGAAKPDADKIIAVCDLFGVSADYLLRENYAGEQADCPEPRSEAAPTSALAGVKRYQWGLLFGMCAGAIGWLAIRAMGLIRADRMSFQWFLKSESLGGLYWFCGVAAVVCGLLLFVPPIFRFFYGTLLDDSEE